MKWDILIHTNNLPNCRYGLVDGYKLPKDCYKSLLVNLNWLRSHIHCEYTSGNRGSIIVNLMPKLIKARRWTSGKLLFVMMPKWKITKLCE